LSILGRVNGSIRLDSQGTFLAQKSGLYRPLYYFRALRAFAVNYLPRRREGREEKTRHGMLIQHLLQKNINNPQRPQQNTDQPIDTKEG
jgi:hypothetical protein